MFVIAYVRSWRLALTPSSILPRIAMALGLMNKFGSKYMQVSLAHVAEGGSIAEEVISTVRTAHTFGTQKILANSYGSHIEPSQAADKKAAIFHGMGRSIFLRDVL